MKKNVSIFLAIYLLQFIFSSQISFAQAPPQTGIMVLPATVAFNLAQGQSGTATIHVTNNLSEKKKFTIYLGDFYRDSLGKHNYMDPGTYAHSCANWVSVNKTFLELAPGQSDEVIVKVQVPDSAGAVTEMKWAMLFCGLVEERTFGKLPKDKISAGVTTNYRIGVHIYQTPPNVNEKKLKLLSFKKVADKKQTYSILYQNLGNTQLDVKSYVELSPLTVATGKGNAMNSERNKIKIVAKNTPLFPEQKRLMEFQIPDSVAKGKYTVTAALDAGSDVPVQAAQGVIEIK